MDSKNFTIGFLIITAGVLLAGILSSGPTSSVVASESVRDRDFQVVTAKSQPSGEALYVLDSRSGMIAVFSVEQGRGLKPRAVGRVTDAFGNLNNNNR